MWSNWSILHNYRHRLNLSSQGSGVLGSLQLCCSCGGFYCQALSPIHQLFTNTQLILYHVIRLTPIPGLYKKQRVDQEPRAICLRLLFGLFLIFKFSFVFGRCCLALHYIIILKYLEKNVRANSDLYLILCRSDLCYASTELQKHSGWKSPSGPPSPIDDPTLQGSHPQASHSNDL